MALNSDSSTALISQFKGSASSLDPYDIDPAHGLYCQNCDFLLGLGGAVQAGTRRGTSNVAQLPLGDGSIPAMDSWYFSLGGVENDYVVYYSPSQGVKAWDQRNQAFVSGLGSILGATTADWSFDGSRLYSAYVGPDGRSGFSGGEIFGLGVGGPDPLFARPIVDLDLGSLSSPTVLGSLSQGVTQGIHLIGFIFTTKNGFVSGLNPVSSSGVPTLAILQGQFTPLQFNATTPNNSWRWTLPFNTLPSFLNGATIQLVMSPVSNVARFYLVPGATAVISSGGTAHLDFSITDNDLVTGTDVTQYVNNIIGGLSPAFPFTSPIIPPFKPSALFQYSSRMGYITKDSAGFPVVFFSSQNAYQSVSLPFGGIYLEGRQIPVQGVSLGGTCYIATLSGLYGTQDNGDLPATWSPPAHIDGSVGVLSASCIQAVGGKILMASEKGLFLFRGGAFPQIPVSYFQASDWNRINWTLPWQVQVLDDSYDKVLRVLAPLSVVITGVTNTSPITIATGVLVNNFPQALPHLFQSGLQVKISGVQGTTSANGTFPITVTGPNTFTIPVGGNGAYVSGGSASPQGANAIMTWAYPEGDSPGEPFYSLQGFDSFRAGAMSVIRNISNGIDEVWWAPAATNPGGLIRRVLPTDFLPFRDSLLSGGDAPITALYETSLLPGSQDDAITVHDFAGAHLRVTGSGPMSVRVSALDRNVQISPVASPVGLSPVPGRELLLRWFLRSEQESIQFSSSGLDNYFLLALIRAYYTNSLPTR